MSLVVAAHATPTALLCALCYDGLVHLQSTTPPQLRQLLDHSSEPLLLFYPSCQSFARQLPVQQTVSLCPISSADLIPRTLRALRDCHVNVPRLDAMSEAELMVLLGVLQHCNKEGILVSLEGLAQQGPSGTFLLTQESVSFLSISCEDLHPSLIKGKGRSKEGYSLLSLFQAKCCSKAGRKILKAWFTIPLRTVRDIKRRQQAVFFAKTKFVARQQNLIKLFKAMGDLGHSAKRTVEGEKGYFNSLRRQMKAALELVETVALEDDLPEALQNLRELKAERTQLQTLQLALVGCLEDKEDSVRQGVNSQLDSLRQQYCQLEDILRMLQKTEAARLQTELRIRYLPQLGYFIVTPCQADPALALDFNFSTPEGHFYKNETVCRLDDDLGDVLSRIVDLETCILRELSVLVAEAMPALLAIRAALASFDAHFALARAGINMTTPVVNTQGDLFIQGGWCLLLNREAIPNNAFVHTFAGDEITNSPPGCLVSSRHSNRTMVLTGANASGKSVYARQLGIICFLAMVGSNVPAKRAAVPLLDAILCLDAQSSIAKGVSLRSSQCAQLQKVVDVATKDSLVIVDELGTGLGHQAGISLCYAAIKYLQGERGGGVPISLHLTHFTELMTKDLVREGERVRFLRMCTVEEQGEHVNSFELGTGYITDSRSFDTAERMGLNREFVGSAKKYFKRLVRGQTVRG